MFGKLREMRDARDYMSYRWFFTNEGKLVVGGKSEDQNELVLRHFRKPNYTVMHTTKPGSPFMIIQADEPSKGDLDECAIFCACFSKEWKTGKKSIDIDIFKGADIFKDKGMKTGTFGVKSKKKVKVRPELMVIIQKGKIRAVPKTKRKEESLAVITPGKMDKEEAAIKIAKKIKEKYLLPVSKEEVMRAIPSGSMSVR